MTTTALDLYRDLADAPAFHIVRLIPAFANQSSPIMFASLKEADRNAEYDRLENKAGGTSRAETGWYYVSETVQPTQRICTLWASGARPEEQNCILHFVGRDNKPLKSTCKMTNRPARGVFVKDCPVESKLTSDDIKWVNAYFKSI